MTEAWDLAHAAARGAGVELRPLTTVDEADLVNEIIRATWGGQRIDREVLRALAVSGNVPYGAFAGDRLIGFVLGWAGVDRDGLHVHSHMLAASPDRRHAGVGYALKLTQRAQALDQGIGVVRWTFDPMVARNAWFNLGKLGTIVDGFERNYYGDMTDAINAGERSDRFTVAWYLGRTPGPRDVAAASAAPTLVARSDDGPRPGPKARGSEIGDLAVVEIPREYHDLRAAQPSLARSWRDAVADAAEACLAAGLQGVAFLRDRSAYVFARSDAEAAG